MDQDVSVIPGEQFEDRFTGVSGLNAAMERYKTSWSCS
jgi:hypothetical protein